MARPERNTVDYFPHILGQGKKMFFIENKYGNDGYATWYKILEKLGSSDHHYLNLNREDELMFLAAKCKVSEETLISIITDLVKIGAFDKEMWDNKIIWCGQFIESISDAYTKRKNKCINLDGLRVLLTGLGILKQCKSKPKGVGNTQRIGEESIEEDIKGNNTNSIELIFPYDSPEFLNSWDLLAKSKKWKNKERSALQASLKKLSKYSEVDAIQMIENCIAGGWMGLVDLKPHEMKSNPQKDGKLTQAAKSMAESREYLRKKYENESHTD